MQKIGTREKQHLPCCDYAWRLHNFFANVCLMHLKRLFQRLQCPKIETLSSYSHLFCLPKKGCTWTTKSTHSFPENCCSTTKGFTVSPFLSRKLLSTPFHAFFLPKPGTYPEKSHINFWRFPGWTITCSEVGWVCWACPKADSNRLEILNVSVSGCILYHSATSKITKQRPPSPIILLIIHVKSRITSIVTRGCSGYKATDSLNLKSMVKISYNGISIITISKQQSQGCYWSCNSMKMSQQFREHHFPMGPWPRTPSSRR